MNDIEQSIMNLIVNSGTAKSLAYSALQQVNDKKYDEAEKILQEAHTYLHLAHDEQTALLTAEANGNKVDISILFIHAQDHLMTAMSEITLIEQIIELRKVVNTLSS